MPGESATLLSNGQAAAPASAPAAVKAVIAAANSIATTPYVWGGGHGSFSSSGYDCSGAVSFALNGGGFLSSPLDSTGLETWGVPGAGSWITVYANSGHAFAVIAGLRWDTSGDVSGTGPTLAHRHGLDRRLHRPPSKRLLSASRASRSSGRNQQIGTGFRPLDAPG